MTILPFRRQAVPGILAGLFLAIAGASAQVVGISNLGEAKTTDYTVDSFQSLGTRFTTGTGTWELTSVDLYASIFVAFPPEANFEVSLYSVSGGLPDQKIVDLTGPTPTATFANLTYVPATATTLQASTSYFIVASSTSVNGSYIWGSTTSTASTGLPGWTLYAGNASYSGSWGLNPNPGGATPMVSVNVVAVPEPSPIALVALAFIGLAAYHRRTSRRRA